MRRDAPGKLSPLTMLLLPACEGRQSALAPAGEDAETLYVLFLVMLVGAAVLWLLVNGLFFYVTRLHVRSISRRVAEALIIGGGIVFPTVVLAALLSYGLAILPDARQPGDGLTVRVVGEQWWWRVEYVPEGAETPIVSANEVRLPSGLRSDLVLNSPDVIHSFWVPALGGKTDMIPGRTTHMSLRPEEPGIYRGQCAEFCGASHALMAFETVVMEQALFDEWLTHEASDAQPPQTPLAFEGAAVFAAEGCGACHAIRGTEARGRAGPDLTHVGSRHSLAAGILGTEVEDFARWIAQPEAIKPEAKMPAFDHLPPEALLALGHYLAGLE